MVVSIYWPADGGHPGFPESCDCCMGIGYIFSAETRRNAKSECKSAPEAEAAEEGGCYCCVSEMPRRPLHV
jgi:hypothetical protein